MTNKTEPTALERLKTAQNDKAELLLISQETLGQIIASLEREQAARDERDAKIRSLAKRAVDLLESAPGINVDHPAVPVLEAAETNAQEIVDLLDGGAE